MISRTACVSFLKQHGYQVLEHTVHDKNQTRFYHFVVKKNGQRLFCKVNNLASLVDNQLNSSLARTFSSPPGGVRLLMPLSELRREDAIFQFFPYVDQLPISTEAAAFKDFRVPEADIDVFLERVIDLIAYIGRQDIVTAYEYKRTEPAEHSAIAVLKAMPADIPYGVELLQNVLRLSELLHDYRLSIHDIQPQNMFWDVEEKVLSVFDLEDLQPNPAYHDQASFFAQLWVVYDRPEYARRFMVALFRGLSADECRMAYAYTRFNLSGLCLKYYTNFKRPEERRRTEALIRWLRLELLSVANDT